MKTKREMREAAIKRLRYAMKHQPRGPLCADDITQAIVGDGWVESSVDEDAEFIINLLTDDDDVCRCHNCIATKRNNDLVELLKDAASDYQSMRFLYNDTVGIYRSLREKMADMVALPKDADGKVIELWDKITYHGPCEKYQDRVYEVRGYGARAGRSIDSVVVRCDSHLETLTAYYCRHYHKPTVEDVLCEFAVACEDAGNVGPEVQRLAGEYAKKLQLKEGEDE